MTTLIVFAHGSSVESANTAVRDVAAELAKAGGYADVRAAFLEGGKPDLLECVEQAASDGANTVLVLPYFLTLGLHLQRDLPNLVAAVEQRHPGLHVQVAAPLDGHAALVQILAERARAVLHKESE